jgi:hypothetical protein
MTGGVTPVGGAGCGACFGNGNIGPFAPEGCPMMETTFGGLDVTAGISLLFYDDAGGDSGSWADWTITFGILPADIMAAMAACPAAGGPTCEINCPADMTIGLEAGECNEVVFFNPTLNDLCGTLMTTNVFAGASAGTGIQTFTDNGTDVFMQGFNGTFSYSWAVPACASGTTAVSFDWEYENGESQFWDPFTISGPQGNIVQLNAFFGPNTGAGSVCTAAADGDMFTAEIDADGILAGGAPNFTLSNLEMVCASDPLVWEIAQTSGIESGTFQEPGEYCVVYTATEFIVDAAICSTIATGNTQECEFCITIEEYNGPVVTALACNDAINVSLDANCEALITADMILEGGPYACFDDYLVETSFGSNLITTCGTFTVTVTDPVTGNTCWGEITTEDKLAPEVEVLDYSVSCIEKYPLGALQLGSTDVMTAGGVTLGAGVCEIFTFDNFSDCTVEDLDVYVLGSSTQMNALDIVISFTPAGGGATVTGDIFTFPGCGGQAWNGIDAIFDEECGNPIALCTDINQGGACIDPIGNAGVLSQFYGMPAQGTWSIKIGEGGIGVIDEVTVTLNGGDGSCSSADITPADFMTCDEATLSFVDWVAADMCNGDVITRTWTVTDKAGNTGQSVQTITVNPIGIGDISLPPAVLTLNTCGADTSPAAIAALFDDPTTMDDTTNGTSACPPAGADECIEYNEGIQFAYPFYTIQTGCGVDFHDQPVDNSVCNIFASFSDLAIPACNPGCNGAQKVIRTWTLLDWCAAQNGGEASVEFQQIIKVVDSEAPSISATGFTVSTDPWGCQATFTLPVPGLHDNCDGDITYTAHGPPGVLVYFDGADWQVSGAPKSQMDPVTGDLIPWIFTFSATDCCKNVGTLDIEVLVVDQAPPVAIATQNIVISLTGSSTNGDGFAKLFVQSVDNGSFDGCTGVKLEIRRDEDPSCDVRGNTTFNDDFPFHSNDGVSNPNSALFDPDNGEFVSFCCADAGTTQKVWLRVWDDGNMDGVVGGIGDNFNETWVNVLVEEKLPPVIQCPADFEIECGWDWQAMSGPATAFDICGPVEVEQTVQDQTDNCGLGRIRVTYCTVPVGNESPVCCTQTITVVDGGSAWDPNAVSFERDRTLACTVSIPDPVQPQWGEGLCDLIGWTSEDQVFFFEDGACRKIVRTYSVVNWCTDETVTGVVNIAVLDDTAPDLSGGIAMYAVDNATDPDEDCDATVILEQTALDPVQLDTVRVLDTQLANFTANFSNQFGELATFSLIPGLSTTPGSELYEINFGCASEWIEWKVEIDIWGDGTIDKVFSFAEGADENFREDRDADMDGICYLPKTANGELLQLNIGEIAHSCNNHVVTWTANDGCNNIVSRTQTFMVTDKKAPTPYCLSVSSAVMPAKGFVELWATDFDLGSSDLCGDVLISFSNTSFQPNKNFTCADDTDGDGVVNVPIYVWDSSCTPNIAVCNVELTLANCGNGGVPRMIAGAVATETGDNVTDVEMNINSDNVINYPASDMTDANGHYAFPNNVENFDYQLQGQKDIDYMNGVSTLDLVLIQKHILGTQTLNSAYKMIAADINDSQDITAIDLVELRKLILGIYNELPNNDSWRMVDATQSLTTANPWIFTEVINIANLATDMSNEDFVGVKIGDVNNSVIASATGVSSENRSNGALTLEVVDRDVQAGETVSVDFLSSDYANVYGYQFTMNLDGATVNGITAGNNEVTSGNISVTGKTMTMSYHNSVAGNISADDVLFTLEMTATQSGNLSELISIGSSVTRAEAYVGENLEVINVDLGVRTDGDVSIVEGYDLYQNEPNPFNGITQIGFTLPQAATATVTVYDVTGKVVKNITTDAVKGYNTIQLTRNDLGASAGVLYYQLESGDFTATKKMIVIE